MRTITKKVKVVQEVEQPIEIYEIGDLLDISKCNPKGKTRGFFRSATRALVMSAKENPTGSITYRVLVNNGTDGLTGYRISDVNMAGVKYVDHWDMKELMGVKK